MDKEKKVMSIAEQMKLMYIVNGVAWAFTGFFEMFDNIPCMILEIIFLAISVFVLFKVNFGEKEMDDEMSVQNLMRAKSAALSVMHWVFFFVSLAILIGMYLPIKIQSITLSLTNVINIIVSFLFIYLGVDNLIVGLYFRRFEESE